MSFQEIVKIPATGEISNALAASHLVEQLQAVQDIADKLNSIIDLKAKLSVAERSCLEAESRLSERYSEIVILTDLLREQTRKTHRNDKQSDWLIKISAELMELPRWWALLPAAFAQRKRNARLARRGLFDSKAYLARYPDVGASGMDPLGHFIRHGLKEDRSC